MRRWRLHPADGQRWTCDELARDFSDGGGGGHFEFTHLTAEDDEEVRDALIGAGRHTEHRRRGY